MELWIRSQDKAILQKVNRLYVCKCAEEKGYGIYDLLYNDLDDCDVPLGFYKTRERALEVLNEIQSFLLGNRKNWCENKNYTGMGIISEITKNQIYEMPED